MMKCEWILCPVCGSKTRNKIRKDTVLENYPLYCPKCRQERYKADELVRNIDVAVRNEKQFCEDINSLENSVGSNIGLLITEMQQG